MSELLSSAWPAILLAAGIGLTINTLVMWITAKKIHHVEEAGIVRCFFCCIQLYVVYFVSMLVLFFPIPYVNIILWLIVWYKLSKWIIEASFDPRDGVGRSILIVYIVLSLGLSFGLRMIDSGARRVTKKYAIQSRMTKSEYRNRMRQELEGRLGDKFEVEFEEDEESTLVAIARADGFGIEFELEDFCNTPLKPEQAATRVVSLMTIPSGEMYRLQLARAQARGEGRSAALDTSLTLGISYQSRFNLAALQAAAKAEETAKAQATPAAEETAGEEESAEDAATSASAAGPATGVGIGIPGLK